MDRWRHLMQRDPCLLDLQCVTEPLKREEWGDLQFWGIEVPRCGRRFGTSFLSGLSVLCILDTSVLTQRSCNWICTRRDSDFSGTLHGCTGPLCKVPSKLEEQCTRIWVQDFGKADCSPPASFIVENSKQKMLSVSPTLLQWQDCMVKPTLFDMCQS